MDANAMENNTRQQPTYHNSQSIKPLLRIFFGLIY